MHVQMTGIPMILEIGPSPDINPKTPLNDDEGQSFPGYRYRTSPYDSSSYSNTDTNNNNDGNIFAKLFDFLGFGGGPTSQLSAEESERLREQTFLDWLFAGGGGCPIGNPDPSHASNNPPLFLGEDIPPSD